MIRIKLVRTGKRNAPVFRVAVGEGSRIKEYLGTYNPQMDPPLIQIDKDKVKEWVKKGAQLNRAVEQLIKGKYEFKPYVLKTAETEEEAPTAPPAPEAPVESPAEKAPAEEKPSEPEEKSEDKPEEDTAKQK